MLPLTARNHPLRKSLTEEMHLRSFPKLAAPAQVVQILALHPADIARTAPFDHVCRLCRKAGMGEPARAKHIALKIGDTDFVWEEHSEFSTYTFVRHGGFDEPFAGPQFNHIPDAWIADLPGEIFRATKIALLDKDMPEPPPEMLARWFRIDDMACCDVIGGAARFWSDFRMAADGFGRVLVHDRGMVGSDASRLIQQIQELGNYRKMALLGLPVAQRLGEQLAAAESRLADLSRAIAEAESSDEALLHDISALSATLARLVADTRYRMGATAAYADLVADRLESLHVRRIPGYASLKDFNERRLLPAVRTCRSVSIRLQSLSEHASWTSALMRTRIDTAMNRQSRDLLASMNRRTQLQLRLQQTVEGLSVVAISYYLVGLVHYAAVALSGTRFALPVELVTGASVPFVLLLVGLGVRRLRHALRGDERG